MQTAVFGFDAFVCDVSGLQDYYQLLDIPCTGSSLPSKHLVTKRLIEQIAHLQRTQAEELDKLIVSAERAMLVALGESSSSGNPAGTISRFGDIETLSMSGSSSGDETASDLGTCTWVRDGVKGDVPYHELSLERRLSMVLSFIESTAASHSPNSILSRPKHEHLRTAISSLLDIRPIGGHSHVCTPKVARVASLLVAAHNVLVDEDEKAPLYTRGGHSALYFLQQANRRSQGFWFSPLVGLLAFRYAVPAANAVRLLIWASALSFVVMVAWNLDAMYPTHARRQLVSEGGYAQYLDQALSWRAVFAPLTVALGLYCGAHAVSVGRLLHLLGPTSLYRFFVRRANLLRLAVPFLLMSIALVVQVRLDGDAGPNSWWVSLAGAWILVTLLVVIECLHLTDSFVMPVTIGEEATVAENHLRLFGPVQSSPQLHQELNTFYLRSVGYSRDAILHLVTQAGSSLCCLVCPAVLVSLIATASFSTTHASIERGADEPKTFSHYTLSATNVEGAPWSWWFVTMHVMVAMWVIAGVVSSWIDLHDRNVSDRSLTSTFGATTVFSPTLNPLAGRWVMQLREFTHATPTRQFVISVVQITVIGVLTTTFFVLLGLKLTDVQICTFMSAAAPLLALCGLGVSSSLYCLVASAMQPRFLPTVSAPPAAFTSLASSAVVADVPALLETQRSRTSVSSSSSNCHHSPIPTFEHLNPYSPSPNSRSLRPLSASALCDHNSRSPSPQLLGSNLRKRRTVRMLDSDGKGAPSLSRSVDGRPPLDPDVAELHASFRSRSPAI